MVKLVMNQSEINLEKEPFISELNSMRKTLKKTNYPLKTKVFFEVQFDVIEQKFNQSTNGDEFVESIKFMQYVLDYLTNNHYELLK